MKKKTGGRLFIAAALAILLVSCSRKPVLVGYCTDLTGPNADLGRSGKNGAVLAEEAVNASGGIRNRKLRLIFGDDRNDEIEAVKADKALIDAGARIVIGHITTAVTKAVLPLMEKTGTLLISPTVSGAELAMKDDMLVMLNASNRAAAFALGRYAAETLKLTSAGILCTTDNPSYTESFLQGFSDGFSASGKALMDIVYFSHQDADFLYSRSIHQLLMVNPGCILIIDSPLDSAMFCRNLHKADFTAPVFVCGWAVTQEFIENGGDSVEGVYFSRQYNPGLSTPEFAGFLADYRRRFTSEPTIASVFSYEAVLIAAEAFSGKGTLSPKMRIITNGEFRGLQETISIDTFGDAGRESHIGKIREGVVQFLPD